jgi:uncharacterized membrane protein YeaQ/YmgE (transglycosylase-associated protein family)
MEDNMHWLFVILIGLVAGWLTGKIMKGSGYGFFWDIILGIVGSLLGGFLATLIHLPASGGIFYSLIIALIGSVIIVFLFRLITGGRG